VIGVNVPAPDMVGPLMAARLLGAGGAVLVFIVVFSALASSLDSLLAATSDLLVQDGYRRHFRPLADDRAMRRAAKTAIVLLGAIAWVACLPRLTNLAAMLHLTGAFVASTIWPVAAGLYWRRANPAAALWAMVLGSAAGLTAYFAIGFYVAALVGAAVSMAIMLAGTLLRPRDFDWTTLDERPDNPANPASSPRHGGDA
jgi:Na+/proline symporter